MVAFLTHDFLLGSYSALVEDIVRWIPGADSKLLERDLSLLKNLLETRGNRYFTIDLPDACKVFERCLADGSLVPIAVPGFGMARHHGRKDLRPRLFWTLWSRVFHTSGSLKESPCTTSIYFLRQLMRLFVKYREECADAYKYAAVQDFVETERGLPDQSLDWEDPFHPYSASARLRVDDFLDSSDYLSWGQQRVGGRNDSRSRFDHYQQVFDMLAAVLPGMEYSLLQGRHGPGAVSDGTGIRSKYEFPTWTRKLESIFPFDWFGSSRLCYEELQPADGIAYSRLLCVPKTAKGPRLIASEPICNQWIQQAIASWFLDAFRVTDSISGSINIKDQSVSQNAARIASNGSAATIDLKSASDRLTCRLVERVFRRRPEILSAFMACRTPIIRQTIDKKSDEWIELRKFSTQGSALTFPIQSYVFYAISVASTLWVKGLRPSLANIRTVKKSVIVYGDDIIVDVSAFRELVDALHQLGLKVNEHKSFGTGKFRESCGSDWYDECDVTPSYITSDFDRSDPTTIATLIEVSNNFFKKGCWVLSNFIAKRVPGSVLSSIPVENGALAVKGLYSYVGIKLDHLKRRYNPILHRFEYLISYLSGKTRGHRPDGILRLRQYFTERPSPDVNWDPVAFSRSIPSFKRRYLSIY